MAIKIQTKQTSIPVVLGDLTFHFDVTDESLANFRKNAEEVKKELEEGLKDIDESNEEKAMEQIKDILRRGYSVVLGEDSFDKIYEMSPSVFVVMEYFVQIIEGIEEEIRNLGHNPSAQEKAKKYLQKKKK